MKEKFGVYVFFVITKIKFKKGGNALETLARHLLAKRHYHI